MSGPRRQPGEMGSFIDGFEVRLTEQGYTSETIRNSLKLVGQVGRWMTNEGLTPSQLTGATAAEFLRDRRADGYRRVPSVHALDPLLKYLKSEGVLPQDDVPSSPVHTLLAHYRTWLVVERGLAISTVSRYENLARSFLEERENAVGNRFTEDLTGTDVIAFLLRETARLSVGSAKGRVAELRSLLRFLYLKGYTDRALATAVPPVAGWHDTTVPTGIAAKDVQQLLDSCDHNDRGGIRDLAILTLVARLGLRSAEVARLELEDLDWRAGEIVVRGKARRRDRLPLPSDVGEALTSYLTEARPQTPIRQVFLALKAPMRAIRPDLVSDVTRRACERAGVAPVGAHRLRHAFATELLSRGSTLTEVSQILRHRDLATTAIYAKVDLGSLRRVAHSWPGAAR